MSDVIIPGSLLAAARTHRLVPVAGAGVSMSVGGSDGHRLFPNWTELLLQGPARLVDEVDRKDAETVEAFTMQGKYLNAATVLKEGLGGIFTRWIREALSRSSGDVSRESLELPRLLWNLGSKIVLTTNYDHVLKWACPQMSDLEEWSRVPPTPSASDLLRPTVWHLHGSISSPHDLVFTDSEYQELYSGITPQSQAFQAVFRDFLRAHTLLFVGFSFDDAFLQAEFAWLQRCFPSAEGRHYVLVEEERVPETKKILDGIKSLAIVPYKNHGAPLLDILARLRDASATIVSPVSGEVRRIGHTARDHLSAIHAYLDSSQGMNDLLQVPGAGRAVPIESIWVEPKFLSGEGEAPLHKILGNRAVLIEAPAGFGKSTLARFIATILARDRLGHPCPTGQSWQAAYLGVDPGKVTQVPLLVNLPDVDVSRGVEAIFEAAIPAIGENERDELIALAQRNEVAFIFDGLDEVAASIHQRILALLLQAQRRWSGCYFLITTRRGDTSILTNQVFSHVRTAGLSMDAGEQLLKRWSLALFSDRTNADLFLEKIRAGLARVPDFRTMFNTPLSIAFICWNYFNSGTLPNSKASLYRSVANWLLESRSNQRLVGGLALTTTKSILDAIAFLLLRGVGDHGAMTAAPIDILVESASKMLSLSQTEIERVIRFETSFNSCLEESGERISFWHANLRDYFAAHFLLQQQLKQKTGLAPELEFAIRNPTWHECIEIFVGLLAIEHSKLVVCFLEAISQSWGNGLAETIIKKALRSRLLDIAVAHGYRPVQGYREQLRNELVEAMKLSDADLLRIGFSDRVQAFSALGVLQLDARLQGKPIARVLALAPNNGSKMGRYPVTVQEFSRFVRAGGYDDIRWRAEFGNLYLSHGWRDPLAWEDQKLLPNAPVVGVSWHEATAYCRWLTAELQSTDSKDTKGGHPPRIIARLPRLDEWFLAAGATQQQGDHHPPSKLAPDRMNESLTPNVPVGINPERRGPNGHEDLCGLIWEWIGPPASKKGRRRRRQVTSRLEGVHLKPMIVRARGVHRSLFGGFRVVFEPETQAD